MSASRIHQNDAVRHAQSIELCKRTLSQGADVAAILFARVELPADLWPVVLSLIGAAEGVVADAPISMARLGERLKGDCEAHGVTESALVKAAQRAVAALEAWQKASGWLLVTPSPGGLNFGTDQCEATQYDLHIAEAIETVKDIARTHWKWNKRGRRAEAICEAIEAGNVLAELRADGRPMRRYRPNIARGGGKRQTTQRAVSTAATLLRQALADSMQTAEAVAATLRPVVNGLAVSTELLADALDCLAAELRAGGASVLGSYTEDSPTDAYTSPLAPPCAPSLPLQDKTEANPSCATLEPARTAEICPAGGFASSCEMPSLQIPPSPDFDCFELPEAPELKTGADPLTEARGALEALTEAGAGRFKLTLVDDKAKAAGRGNGWRGDWAYSAAQLARALPVRIAEAEAKGFSLCLRPLDAPHIVQLDDATEEELALFGPLAFVTFETSPGSYQPWLSLPPELPAAEAKAIKPRLYAALKAWELQTNGGGGGSVRIGRNHKYTPAPVVRVVSHSAGRIVTAEELAGLSLLSPEPEAPEPEPTPGRAAGRQAAAPERRGWPDYDRSLAEASRKANGEADRSAADFKFALLALLRGWSELEVCTRLLEVSERAQASGRKYVLRTVGRAARSASAARN